MKQFKLLSATLTVCLLLVCGFIHAQRLAEEGDIENSPVLEYKKLMPEDFIAGFVHHPGPCSEDFSLYGIFLVKDSKGYMLVLNKIYDNPSAGIMTNSVRIDNELANKMAESFPSYYFNVKPVENQEKGKAGDKNNDKGNENEIITTIYDGSDIIVLKPGKVATYSSEYINEGLWREQCQRLQKGLKPRMNK
jgi:hypothetical protein